MADEDEAQENGEEGAEEKPSFLAKNKKMLLLVVVALLLVGISVGGTLAALKFLAPPEVDVTEGEEGAEGEEALAEAIKPAIYYPLKPPIMVSYDARGRQRLMQAEITLLARDADVITAVETHMPMIRNALVLLMSGQTYEEVQTAEGKELLRVQCLQVLQEMLDKEIGKPGIEQVLFTNLILQ